MIKDIFNALFYEPLYNGLIFLIGLLPGADVGLAVILLTLVVKLLLFPLSAKAIRTQLKMKEYEGELATLKKRYANDREAQAKALLSFYREKKINPFSSFLTVFIQLPVVLALYYVFFRGGLPEVNASILYPFVSVPDINMNFLGLIDVSQKSLSLAFLAGTTQFLQMRFAAPPFPKAADGDSSFQATFARSMHLQMRYLLPVVIFFVSWSVSGAIALYLATSTFFSFLQELYLRRKLYPPLEKGASAR